MRSTPRRAVVAVIGDAKFEADDPKEKIAREVGRRLVDAGFRVLTGGLGGVMAAAMNGARESAKYVEGDTIAVLPGYDPDEAAESADIVLATGLNLGRNVLVANSDAVIAVGGGAGTLSEIALAWQMRRPIVAVSVSGWSEKLGAVRIDRRRRQPDAPDDQVHRAADAAEAVRIVIEILPKYPRRIRHV